MERYDIGGRIAAQLFSRTPVILQSEAAECGLACMAMIASRYGHRVDLPAIRRRFSASLKGTTLAELIRLGAGLGLATRAVRLDLDGLGELRLPCILHWNHNHFVVLTKVGPRRVTVHDPAVGLRSLSMEELSKGFTGVALEAWPAERFERKDERARIRISSLLRKAHGLGGAFLQLAAISIVLEIAILVMPIGVQLILDEVVVAADRDLLTVIVIGLVMFLALQVATGLARSWISMLVGSSLALQWKVSLFTHLMHLPLGFFERRHVGDVVSRFGSLDVIQRTMTTSAMAALMDGVMAVAVAAMMWIYGGWLLAVALATTAVYALFRLVAYIPFRTISEEAIVHAAQENSHFMESVGGMSSLKALNLEERRRAAWINHLVDRINADLKVQKFGALFDAVSTGFFGLDRILLIFLGTGAVIAGDMSVGMLVAFLAYKDQFSTRMERFVDTGVQFMMLSVHGERIADIALAPPEREEAGQSDAGRETERPPALPIALRGVRFRYGDGEPDVLQGIDLDVAPGECVGIAGPSGAGKTTLLKIMAGLIEPTAGQVTVAGAPLTAMGARTYRERIGCVLQDDRLFSGSIAENIAGFAPAADRDRVAECAITACIHDEIMAMPMGYETLVGDMGSTLSGGQRQRVVLARALFRRPSVLLLDEATSHLDPANEAAINAAVRTLGMTRVIIAHRQSTLDAADHVYWIVDGKFSTS